jgi:hypothetical protein
MEASIPRAPDHRLTIDGAMEFRLLGPFEARHDGRPVEVGGRRQERCLLALLLLEAGRIVPIDRLVDLLWDGGAARCWTGSPTSRCGGGWTVPWSTCGWPPASCGPRRSSTSGGTIRWSPT